MMTAGLAAALLLIAIGWRVGNAIHLESAGESESLSYARPTTAEILERPTLGSNRKWQEELALLGLISTTTENATGTTTLRVADVISQQFIDSYIALKESGRYSPAVARQIGQSIGENVRAPSLFIMHGEGELKKDADVSPQRVLSYRADMRDALLVLITDAPPEFETFGLYIEKKNPQRLRELEEASGRYQAAEQATLQVIVPSDAASLHLRVVNSLGAYADALRQLIRYADEPLTILAVLRTYNDTEREMLYAFDALASYYVQKSAE